MHPVGGKPLVAYPLQAALDAARVEAVYVSTDAIKSVSAIDVQTRKEVARISVGEVPRRLSTLVLP